MEDNKIENSLKKLKQNDRIEYLIRFNHIKSYYNSFTPLYFYYISLILLVGAVLLLGMASISYDDETKSQLESQSTHFLYISLISFLFSLLSLILESLSKRKQMNKLNEEFFRIEPKNQNGKERNKPQ